MRLRLTDRSSRVAASSCSPCWSSSCCCRWPPTSTASVMIAEYKAADSYRRSAQARPSPTPASTTPPPCSPRPTRSPTTSAATPTDNPSVFQGVAVAERRSAALPRQVQHRRPPLDPTIDMQPAAVCPTLRRHRRDRQAQPQRPAEARRQRPASSTTVLMKLPNMTEDIANAILDWIDADDDAAPGGAENEYYIGLSPAYRCKNGPLDSLEELLLVQGVTPELLFGNDRNRNGMLDPDEDDGSGRRGPRLVGLPDRLQPRAERRRRRQRRASSSTTATSTACTTSCHRRRRRRSWPTSSSPTACYGAYTPQPAAPTAGRHAGPAAVESARRLQPGQVAQLDHAAGDHADDHTSIGRPSSAASSRYGAEHAPRAAARQRRHYVGRRHAERRPRPPCGCDGQP